MFICVILVCFRIVLEGYIMDYFCIIIVFIHIVLYTRNVYY